MFSLIICAFVLSSATDLVQAKYGYHPNIKRWMKGYEYLATWEEAKEKCQSEGAVLASPINTRILSEMKTLINVNHRHNSYFIGTRTNQYGDNIERPFVSIEGVLLDDMPVAEMLERLDPQEGDCLSMDVGIIRAVPCWRRLPYVCYATIKGCDEGYEQASSDRKCYKLHLDRKKFTEAEATCVAEGGHLAVLNNYNEAKNFKELLSVIDEYPYTYVGLKATGRNGDWRSVYGDRLEDLYNDWKSGSTPPGQVRKCAVFLKSGKLDDYGCDYDRDFICEKDINY